MQSGLKPPAYAYSTLHVSPPYIGVTATPKLKETNAYSNNHLPTETKSELYTLLHDTH